MQNENNRNNTNNPQPQNTPPNNFPLANPIDISGQKSLRKNDDLLSGAKLQLELINQKNKGEMEKELSMIDAAKVRVKQPGTFRGEEGVKGLEEIMRALNMPGIYEKTRAKELLNLREEAIIEKNNLDQLGKNWNMQPADEQDEIADRVRWGAECQNFWQIIILRRDARGVSFKAKPDGDNEKLSQQDLINMVINEIELSLSRNPETRDKAKDTDYLKDKAKQIALGDDFLSLMNSQTKENINIKKIRDKINNLLKKCSE